LGAQQRAKNDGDDTEKKTHGAIIWAKIVVHNQERRPPRLRSETGPCANAEHLDFAQWPREGVIDRKRFLNAPFLRIGKEIIYLARITTAPLEL
jgi:hypothetical protein